MKMKISTVYKLFILFLVSTSAMSAVSPDRTRIILNESEKSSVITLKNSSSTKAYMSQSWVENSDGEVVKDIFSVTPYIQRVEANSYSYVKIEPINVDELPKDRESMYYFNVREIPPKSNKSNVLQMALRSKIKLLYRPKEIKLDKFKEKEKDIKINVSNTKYRILNPTPYYMTVVGFSSDGVSLFEKGFSAKSVAPFSSVYGEVDKLIHSGEIVFINDFGGKVRYQFNCALGKCDFKD